MRNGSDRDEERRSTALVPVETSRPRRIPALGERPLADFVTQLIACDRQVEAYRRHRRAAPEAASASYSRADEAGAAVPSAFERLL